MHGYTVSLFSLFPPERPAPVSQGLGTKVALLLLDLALTVDLVSLALALQQPRASSKSQFLPPLPPQHFHISKSKSKNGHSNPGTSSDGFLWGRGEGTWGLGVKEASFH